MRILMVSDVYFPRINGVSTSIATYRESLLELGHEVTLIAPAYPAGHKEEDWILRAASRGVWLDPEDRMMHYRAVTALAGGLHARGFDILHIQTPFVAHYGGLRLAAHLGIPVVESYHTYFEEYLGCYVPFLPGSLMRRAARAFSLSQGNAVDALVVPSSAMHEKLGAYGVATATRVIPTGLNMRHFKGGDRMRFRQDHGIDPGCPTLLYVGRVAHEKNIDFLFEALVEIRKVLPSVLLIVTGEGPAAGHLQRLAARLELERNVKFVGYLDRESALLDCYAAADVFVFSSRTETQGLVLLEAMAMGLPVVAPAIMGTRDVLRDGSGALVAIDNDHADFASKVLRLLLDKAIHREQSRRARAYASTWSNEACARKLLTFYGDTIEKRQARTAPRRGAEPEQAPP